MPNFEELGFKFGSTLFWLKPFVSDFDRENRLLSIAKPPSWIGETNLENHLLEVRHMLRLNFFYLAIPNSI